MKKKVHIVVIRFIAIMIAVVLALPTTVIVNAQGIKEARDVDEDTSFVASYFDVDDDGNVTYKRDLAISDGINEDLLDLADKVCAYAITQSGSEIITIQGNNKAIAKLKAKATAFPAYGNWCGPGYGSGTPIDLLDTGCRSHDKCYKNKGYHKCSCDKTFLKYVQDNYSKMTGASQKAMAVVIETWLKIKTKHVTANGGNFSCRK